MPRLTTIRFWQVDYIRGGIPDSPDVTASSVLPLVQVERVKVSLAVQVLSDSYRSGTQTQSGGSIPDRAIMRRERSL